MLTGILDGLRDQTALVSAAMAGDAAGAAALLRAHIEAFAIRNFSDAPELPHPSNEESTR
jgi:DNA-binding GntR family transcriptional regulator